MITPPSTPLCAVRWRDGDAYLCGRSVETRDARTNGCLGALFICDKCFSPVMEFIDKAQDARAVRKEWTTQ